MTLRVPQFRDGVFSTETFQRYQRPEQALVLALPEKYRRRMKSTNMQERLIQEVRRRERVIRIFPIEQSAHRLIGALVTEIYEEWQSRRCGHERLSRMVGGATVC